MHRSQENGEFTIAEKQDIVNRIYEVYTRAKLRETRLQFEYDKWIEDWLSENQLSFLNEKIPVNSTLNAKEDKLYVLIRDLHLYHELISKFLKLNIPTVTYQGCLRVVNKECAEFQGRLDAIG